jgi:flavorubredoxin
MVHWPEVMVAYDETEKILFSADAFGTFGTLDGGVLDSELNVDRYWEEMIRYYANIVGKYGNPVQKALQKLSSLDIQTICATHGPVWQQEIGKVIALYDKLSRYEAEEGVTIIYGSMYGNTERMAEVIASSIAAEGIKNIVIHNVSKSPASFILKDVFKYKGVLIGGPTYSGDIFPKIDSMLKMLEVREVKNKIFGYFGSFTWAGAAVKRLAAFNEKMKWEVVGDPVEMKQSMNAEASAKCISLGQAMARQLKIEN